MRMSFWQFLGIVAVLAAGWWVYNNWWVDQDQNSWIRGFNSSVMESDAHKLEPKPKEEGWI
jgi:hypothetical protein